MRVVKDTTLRKLDALNVELDVLRSLLRMAYEVHFLNGQSLGYIISQIDEIGRMRGGWAKNYLSSSSKSDSWAASPLTWRR